MMPRNKVPAEIMDQARAMIEDGASVLEITRTTGMARETVIKHFPGASWSHAEAGSVGRQVRIFNERMRKL